MKCPTSPARAAIDASSMRCGLPQRVFATAMALVALAPCTAWPGSLRAMPHEGQRLEDALLELNARGAGLVFSSETVTGAMRVLHTPAPADPVAIARVLLAPHGLALVPGPGGRWLVTKGADPPPADPRAATAAASDTEAPPPLDEVVVLASRYRLYGSDRSAEFRHAEIDRLPHLADDLMRAISRLPAVASDDFSARISLRGGAREECALYLDGLELVDPFHLKDLQGALSIVDSNLVDRVDLYAGGFPAMYGDSASGIVDIHTLPVPDENVYSVGISFINAYANGRGRFESGHGGWLVSVRRGYLDWLFKLIDTGEGVFSPRYLDVLAKIEHDVGERHVVSAHVLAAKDDLTYLDESEDTAVAGRADSLFLWARWTGRWSDRLRSETVLWRGSIDRRRDFDVNDPGNVDAALNDVRELRFRGLRSDWHWAPHGGWRFGFGIELADKRVDYDYRLTSVTTAPEYPGRPDIDRQSQESVHGETAGVYASAGKDFGRLSTELGYRWDAERYTGLDQNVSGPRFSARYEFAANTRLLFAWGDYHQFQPIETLQVEDGVEVFGPATDVDQFSLGLEHGIGTALSLRTDLYRKRYRSLRPRFTNLFDSYEPIPEAEPDRYRVDAASADAWGFEFTMKSPAADGFSWWGSYTYSRVDDRIDDIDTVREWDQPHALNLVLNWRWVRWNLNVASAWHSGWPRTEPEFGTVDTSDGLQDAVVPGDRNATRYGDYVRVDARISRDVQLKRGTFTYFFEIYNLLDSENPCCIDEVTILPGAELRVGEENWLPRMPSFGFRWTFR